MAEVSHTHTLGNLFLVICCYLAELGGGRFLLLLQGAWMHPSFQFSGIAGRPSVWKGGAEMEAWWRRAGALPRNQQEMTTLSPEGRAHQAEGTACTGVRREAGARDGVRGAGQPTTDTVAPSAWLQRWRWACSLRGQRQPWLIVEGSPAAL